MSSSRLAFWPTAALTIVCMTAAFLFWVCLWFFPGALLKLLVPLSGVRRALTTYLVWVAGNWVSTNHLVFRLIQGRASNRHVDQGLDMSRSWLVIGNHQSWADILILADTLRGSVRFPRFFLKRELIWVPLLGLACWSLDMPFMKRHSARAVAENPALRGQDLETTRRACQRFRGIPVVVVNYLEGTRFTPAKRDATASPYRFLLKPKTAGLTYALHAMGDQFDGLVDVTIGYRPSRHSKLWSFLGGEQTDAYVRARLRPLPQELVQLASGDEATLHGRVKAWAAELWAEKDAELASWASAPVASVALHPRGNSVRRA